MNRLKRDMGDFLLRAGRVVNYSFWGYCVLAIGCYITMTTYLPKNWE